MITIQDNNKGELKVIRTRDFMLVEASMAFRVDEEVICDETFVFPENKLLIMGTINQFMPIKRIFQKDSRTSMMQVTFSEQGLAFEIPDPTKKARYEINQSQLIQYGTYLDAVHEPAKNYQIFVPMKNLFGILKVVELVGGDFKCAMEVQEDTAVCFFFTNTQSFTFQLGLSGVRFENKEDQKQVTR